MDLYFQQAVTKAVPAPKEPVKQPKKVVEKTKVIETLNPGSAVSLPVHEHNNQSRRCIALLLINSLLLSREESLPLKNQRPQQQEAAQMLIPTIPMMMRSRCRRPRWSFHTLKVLTHPWSTSPSIPISPLKSTRTKLWHRRSSRKSRAMRNMPPTVSTRPSFCSIAHSWARTASVSFSTGKKVSTRKMKVPLIVDTDIFNIYIEYKIESVTTLTRRSRFSKTTGRIHTAESRSVARSWLRSVLKLHPLLVV